jgi:hypothetical protein
MGAQLGRSEQLTSQILKSSDAGPRGVYLAPAHAGRVQHRADQGEAGVLARQPPDHPDPAAGLAEGPLQQVGVADALAVPDREVEVGGERGQVVEQAVDGLRVAMAVLLDEPLGALVDRNAHFWSVL